MSPKKNSISPEFEAIFHSVEEMLNMMVNDSGVPRNIRKLIQEALDAINSKDSAENTPAMTASTCTSLLEDIVLDINCPSYTRTRIYQITAQLEKIRDED